MLFFFCWHFMKANRKSTDSLRMNEKRKEKWVQVIYRKTFIWLLAAAAVAINAQLVLIFFHFTALRARAHTHTAHTYKNEAIYSLCVCVYVYVMYSLPMPLHLICCCCNFIFDSTSILRLQIFAKRKHNMRLVWYSVIRDWITWWVCESTSKEKSEKGDDGFVWCLSLIVKVYSECVCVVCNRKMCLCVTFGR